MKTVAFFDFDGTISHKDSFFKFIRFCVGDFRFFIGIIVLSPVLILYLLKLISNYRAKQFVITWFFKGFKKSDFKKLADEFSLNQLKKIIRKDAIDRLNWHRENEHKIVIVSASIYDYLHLWCEDNKFNLIATQLEVIDTILTGKLSTKNCYGIEKVNRIKAIYDLSSFDYIYAYGDSNGDKEMLKLANESFYKPFR